MLISRTTTNTSSSSRKTFRLLGSTTTTASDFAGRALEFIPASGTDQEEVGRATAIDGYNPSVTTFVGTTHTTNQVTGVTTLTGISVGSIIAAADITGGQTVTAISGTGPYTLTLSAAASGSNTSESMTATGSYGNERTVSVCVTSATGTALNSDTMTAVGAYLETFREVNFQVYVVAPNTSGNTVYVTVSVQPVPGVPAATIQTNVQTALLNYLTPQNFGLPQGAITGWNNQTTIYLSAVLAVIQGTQGVLAIPAGGLAIGLTASPTNTTNDVTLVGPFPLPSSTTVSIPTSAITVL